MMIRQGITSLLRRTSAGMAPSIVCPEKSFIIAGTATSLVESTQGTYYARAAHFRFFSTAKDDKQEKVKEEVTNEDDTVTLNFLPRDGDGESDGLTEKDIKGVDMAQYNDEVKLKMPDMESDGKVQKWYKKEGDIIRRNEKLCDIELESFAFGMESDDEGITIMGPILVEENTEAVKPGTQLATILHRDDEFGNKKAEEEKTD